MYLGKYGLPKQWLDECLKGPFQNTLRQVNMLKAPKHF